MRCSEQTNTERREERSEQKNKNIWSKKLRMRPNTKRKKRNSKRPHKKPDVKKEHLKWTQNANEVGSFEARYKQEWNKLLKKFIRRYEAQNKIIRKGEQSCGQKEIVLDTSLDLYYQGCQNISTCLKNVIVK